MAKRAQILECIPNFSEGRDASVVDRIVDAALAGEGVYLLRRESDVDHNRSVLTLAGDPNAIVDAAVRAVGKAVELIDLTAHGGQHPRMGAADVVPFVPIKGLSMEECVMLARWTADRIWNELGVPVYLYEESALVPEHRNLADIRRGGFEAIRESMASDPKRRPDVGGPSVHPTAGITAVGARHPLIAFNVDLSTDDLSIAKSIAKSVRQSSGGLAHVKALGIDMKSRGCVQVSMNLVSYKQTAMHEAYDVVLREAERHGVEITSTEIIGLVPQDALIAAAASYLRIKGFSRDLVLENRLLDALGEE